MRRPRRDLAGGVTAGSRCAGASMGADRGDPQRPSCPFRDAIAQELLLRHRGTAAIAYCARLGFAVVSGDPIGECTQLPEFASEFAVMCRSRGWRIVVLGCGEQWLGLWRDGATIGRSLRPVPFGRDVVIDVRRFNMAGRKYRNLLQPVQRTHNSGITTEVVAEQDSTIG